MKKILLQVPSQIFENNQWFASGMNDQNNMWIELKRRLLNLGYDLITADNNSLDDCEWIFFIDSIGVKGLDINRGGIKSNIKSLFGIKTPRAWPIRPLYQEAIEKGMRDRLVLFLWEGQAVNPHNYKIETWNKFDRLFTWRDDLVDNKKFLKFYLPTPIHSPPSRSFTFSEKKMLVNMSNNRYSDHKNELYKERRKTISYFDSNYPDDFDLYGANWGKPVTRLQKMFPWIVKEYKTYRGIAQKKIETISKYKFALCYENLSKTDGYITEKIFDCFTAKTIPIYWGANNIDKYVDPKAFIDRRQFSNNIELADYLKKIKEEEYYEILSMGQRYLNSDKYKLFLENSFCENIIKNLQIKKATDIS